MFREVRDNTLYFDGCNTVELARKYGTPLYVYSESDIIGRFNELKTCFLEKYPCTLSRLCRQAFFPVAMAKLVAREGMCVDVVSGGELYTATKPVSPQRKLNLTAIINRGRRSRWLWNMESAESLSTVCRN